MGIPDDAQLKEQLRKILANADLESFTKRAARRELEKALNLDEGGLDERKQDIADWVEEYIQEKDNEKEEEEGGDSEAESEEEDKKPAKPEKKAKGGKGWKPQWLKPALAEFAGTDEMKRTDVVKMIWDHVKSNNLQDPSNKQFFICDEKLFKLFGKKRIHCFKMNKDLSKLMHPVEAAAAPKRKARSDDDEDDDDDDASDGSSSPPPKRKASSSSAAAPAKKRAKTTKKGGGGFQAEVQLSEELSGLLGSDRMPRTQVVKGLWAYIKEHNLQDPKNKMRILPDPRMRTVFGKDPFTGFSMMKLLGPHISKI